jgi:hypothetical protein
VVVSVLAGCGADDGPSDATIAPLITTTSAPTTTTATTTATTVPVTAGPVTTPAPSAVATTASPTSAVPGSTTSTTTLPAAARLVLGPDGIGDALFGADPGQVVSYVTSVLGAPTGDSDWVNATSDFPECPGDDLRVVRWQDLSLLFADVSPAAEARRHFSGYVLGPPRRPAVAPAGMLTAQRIGVGSTVGELRFTHPDVVLWVDELRAESFLLPNGINGTVEGFGDGAFVTMIMAGPRCDG